MSHVDPALAERFLAYEAERRNEPRTPDDIAEFIHAHNEICEDRKRLSARVMELEGEVSDTREDARSAADITRAGIVEWLRKKAKSDVSCGYLLLRAASEVENFDHPERLLVEAIAAWLEREASDNTEWEVSQLRSNAWRTAATGGGK